MNLTQQLEGIQHKKRKGKTRSEIGRGSKRKGKTGEQKIVNILKDVTQKSWVRVPNSGAFVGQTNRDRLKTLTKTQGFIQIGDVIPPDDLKYRFIIESKNYQNLDIHNLLNPGFSKQVNEWISELEYDVESCITLMGIDNVLGMLVINLTRKGMWVILNKGALRVFKVAPIRFQNHLMFFRNPKKELYEHNYTREYILTDFKEYIEYNRDILFEEK